ncbi:MAG: Rne/Rng family ribonuclease, partial [Pseudomonadota bacterium]
SVLMPNTARGGGISRKITNISDRKRLKDIVKKLDVPKGMGVILRTAGASQPEQEVVRDYDYLMRLWDNVRDLTLSSSAPSLVYEEGSLIKRAIRDLYNSDFKEVVVSGDNGFREAKDFMAMMMPDNAGTVKRWTDPAPILAKTGMEAELDKLVQPQVTLKSGGYLIINQTEALVAIDVNSGKSTREHSIEETALATNLEAAEEVSRQLRLRDLAGLIVIDFIDMEEQRNNRSVEKRLKECLKSDRARIQVGRISHFGLMEMSRQRMRASVLESTMSVCKACNGTGYVRSPQAIALHLVRSLEEQLTRNAKFDLGVRTPVDTALYLLNKKRETLTDMEERFGVTITVDADNEIGAEMFAIERGGVSDRVPRETSVVSMGVGDEADADNGSGDADGSSEGRNEGSGESFDANSFFAPQTETSEDDDQGKGRKRKRRRRGGKNRDRDEQPAEADAASATDTETDSNDGDEDVAAADGEENGDERRGRKRRRRSRGKRGGRNRRNRELRIPDAEPVGPLADLVASGAFDEEAAAEHKADVEPKADAEHAETEAVSVTADAVEVQEPSESVAAEPEVTVNEPAVLEVDDSADSVEAVEDAAPQDDDATDDGVADSEGDGESESDRQRATEANIDFDVEPVVVSATEPEEKPKKRAGWWSRRGFL